MAKEDLITIFKFINGFDWEKLTKSFIININWQNNGLIHHKSQMKSELVKNLPERYYFLANVVSLSAKGTRKFKNKLDKWSKDGLSLTSQSSMSKA